MEKIRLNQQKRQLLKKEWQHTVYNNMPMQVEEDLRLAQENYRSVREDTWAVSYTHLTLPTNREV